MSQFLTFPSDPLVLPTKTVIYVFEDKALKTLLRVIGHLYRVKFDVGELRCAEH